MSHESPQTIAYAVPARPGRRAFGFQVVTILLAATGVAANSGFIVLAVDTLHRSAPVHANLVVNPRAYGREIDPRDIESLRRPVRLWASESALIVAAGFGLVLALVLLSGAASLHRDPVKAGRRLAWYGRWKGAGAALTTAAMAWALWESESFWGTATRHTPVGGGPQACEAVALFACAMLPVWWVRKAVPAERKVRPLGVPLSGSEMPDFNFVLDEEGADRPDPWLTQRLD